MLDKIRAKQKGRADQLKHDLANSFRIGRESAKANAVPIAVLWMLASASVLAYYALPGVAAALEPLAHWQAESGWWAAFLNRVFFLGLLPGVFLLTVRRIRPDRPVVTIIAQTLWCGVWGVVTDWFYRFQFGLFGGGVDVATLLAKTLFDQFVFTALVNAPANAVFFFWVSRNFSAARFRMECPRPFVRGLVLPNLVANWCVGIPATFVLYAFPPPLQLQVSGFVYAFWILMCLQIGRRSAPGKEAVR